MTAGVVGIAVAMLVVGAVLGLVSRLLLGRRSSLTMSASVLAGIAGAAIGGALTHLLTGSPDQPRWVLVTLFSVLGTMAVLLAAERFVHRPAPTTSQLLAAGESARVEFKSTARHNLRSGQRDDRIEAVIAKTIAGFSNSEGGTLLIGVADDGTALGLAPDLALMKNATVDAFELWLHDYLTRTLGAPAVAGMRVSFPTVDGLAVCRVEVPAARRPVFVRAAKSDQVQFFVRLGNSTRELSVDDAIEYAARRFRLLGWRPARSASLD